MHTKSCSGDRIWSRMNLLLTNDLLAEQHGHRSLRLRGVAYETMFSSLGKIPSMCTDSGYIAPMMWHVHVMFVGRC